MKWNLIFFGFGMGEGRLRGDDGMDIDPINSSLLFFSSH